MSEKVWYYSVNGDRKGPVDESAMKALVEAGVVESETPVWQDGMADWAPAYRHVKGLVPPAPGSVPPRASGPVGGVPQAEPAGMGRAFSKAFSNFATFSGRASRSEFWWFVLASFLVSLVALFLDYLLIDITLQVTVFYWIWYLVALLPTLAVGARRLHDTNRTGWWQLIGLVPLVGIIVLIVFWAQEGERKANQYG